MNRILAVMTVGSVLCGCVNMRPVPSEPQPPRQIADITSAPVVQAPVAQAVVVQTPVAQTVVPVAAPVASAPVSVVRGHATATAKPLRVLVSLDDGNDAGKPSTCKRTLQTNLEGALARAGFKVVYAKPAEVLVYGTLRASKVNERGSRVAWKGDASMEITRAPEVNSINGQVMCDVVSKERFDAKSGDARSNDEAQQQIADRLGPKVAAFAQTGVNKVGGQLKLVELLVVNAWQPQDAAGYPTFFTQKVSAMKGVYSCRIVSTDNATRTMRAEVIYDSAEYADGFLNRIYTMSELNIVR